MRYAVALAGFAVIAIVTIIGQRRTGEKPGTRALRDLARTVRAPLTAEVEAWLRPQLRRREEWIGMGATLGLVAGNLPFLYYPMVLPWYWFSGLLGAAAGTIIGTLAAGYRTVPRVDGSLRTVSPRGRQVGDYLSRRRLVLMRCALPMPLVAFALGAAVTAYGSRERGLATMVSCGAGALVVVSSLWAQRALVRTPMVSSTTEDLLWQEALMARTIGHLPLEISFVGWFSAAVGVYAALQARADLPWWVLLATGVLLLACLTTLAAAAHSYRPGRADPTVPTAPAGQHQRESSC